MRPLAYVFAACLVAAPVAGAAVRAPGDGSLVVQNGAAPWSSVKTAGQPADVPVAQFQISGSVIGHVDGLGRIVIDAGDDTDASVTVLGAGRPADWKKSDTAQMWTGTDFKFRAVNGTFTILVYGSDVNLVAVGKGKVRLAGLPDTPRLDGHYSLNDADFRSLPSVQSPNLSIGTTG